MSFMKHAQTVVVKSRDGLSATIVEMVGKSIPGGIEAAKPFEIRSPGMTFAQPGTFWSLTGLSERKPASVLDLGRKGEGSPRGSRRNGSKGQSRPSWLTEHLDPEEHRTATHAKRLWVGWRPKNTSRENILTAIAEEGLRCNLTYIPDALHVGGSSWCEGRRLRLAEGRLKLDIKTTRSKLELLDFGTLQPLDQLDSGEVWLLLDAPTVERRVVVDLRSAEQVMQDAAPLLSRLETSLSNSTHVADLRSSRESLLRAVEENGSVEDQRELHRLLEVLSERRPLADILPELVRTVPRYREEVERLVEAEKAARLSEIDVASREAVERGRVDLEKLEQKLSSKRVELETVSIRIREQSIAATELEKAIDSKIEASVGRIYGLDPDSFAVLVNDMQFALSEARSLQKSKVEKNVTESTSRDFSSLPEDEGCVKALRQGVGRPNDGPAAETVEVETSRDARTEMLRSVCDRSKTDFGTLALTLGCAMTGRLPLLSGEHSLEFAELLASVVGGGSYFITFCNPTLASSEDLFVGHGNRSTAFTRSVEIARAEPGRLVPIILANLDLAPYQYWIDSLFDRRSVAGLPSNLVVLATVCGFGEKVRRQALKQTVGLRISDQPKRSATATPSDGRPWGVIEPDRRFDALDAIENVATGTTHEGTKRSLADALRCASGAVAVEPIALEDAVRRMLPWLDAVTGSPSDEPLLALLTDGRK